MKKNIIFSLLLIIAGILIIIINKIIGNFDWHLRSEYIWIASFMIPTGLFLLGLFSLKTIKNRGSKIFFYIFWTLIFLIVIFIEYMLLCWFIKLTIVKEIDGVKYCGVGNVTNRLKKDVYYYEEYNIFAYHETKKCINEFYNYDNYEYPLYRIYYTEKMQPKKIYDYDEKGNITNIITYDEKGAIVNVDKLF